MDNVINGKLLEACEPQTGEGANGAWKRQNFIIETFAQYPRKVCFTVANDKIDMSQFPIGSIIAVSINIESREYNGRWYTDFRAWRVEQGQQVPPQNEIQGTVTFVGQEASGTSQNGKQWKRQEFVIETSETYPKKISFSIWGDRINKTLLTPGKAVTVSVDLESRKSNNGSWFSSAQAYRIVEGIQQQQPMPQAPSNQTFGVDATTSANPFGSSATIAIDPLTSEQAATQDAGDDLPF